MSRKISPSKKYKKVDLQWALTTADPALLEKILNDGLNPNLRIGEFNKPALELAILTHEGVRAEMIQCLLRHGANPNLVDRRHAGQISPFMRACMRGDEKSAAVMMDSVNSIKVDLLLKDSLGWIPSIASAASGCSPAFLSKMQSFFESNTLPGRPELGRGYLWSCVDQDGKNAAMQSYDIQGSLRWIFSQAYIDPGKLIEATDNKGETVLWIASDNNNMKSVNLLLGLGARVDMADANGKTMLQMIAACNYGHNAQVVKTRDGIQDALKSVAASQAAMSSINEMMNCHSKAYP